MELSQEQLIRIKRNAELIEICFPALNKSELHQSQNQISPSYLSQFHNGNLSYDIQESNKKDALNELIRRKKDGIIRFDNSTIYNDSGMTLEHIIAQHADLNQFTQIYSAGIYLNFTNKDKNQKTAFSYLLERPFILKELIQQIIEFNQDKFIDYVTAVNTQHQNIFHLYCAKKLSIDLDLIENYIEIATVNEVNFLLNDKFQKNPLDYLLENKNLILGDLLIAIKLINLVQDNSKRLKYMENLLFLIKSNDVTKNLKDHIENGTEWEKELAIKVANATSQLLLNNYDFLTPGYINDYYLTIDNSGMFLPTPAELLAAGIVSRNQLMDEFELIAEEKNVSKNTTSLLPISARLSKVLIKINSHLTHLPDLEISREVEDIILYLLKNSKQINTATENGVTIADILGMYGDITLIDKYCVPLIKKGLNFLMPSAKLTITKLERLISEQYQRFITEPSYNINFVSPIIKIFQAYNLQSNQIKASLNSFLDILCKINLEKMAQSEDNIEESTYNFVIFLYKNKIIDTSKYENCIDSIDPSRQFSKESSKSKNQSIFPAPLKNPLATIFSSTSNSEKDSTKTYFLSSPAANTTKLFSKPITESNVDHLVAIDEQLDEIASQYQSNHPKLFNHVEKIIKYLLNNPSIVNTQNSQGQTIAHFLVLLSHHKIFDKYMEKLLKINIDCSLVDHKGKTPLSSFITKMDDSTQGRSIDNKLISHLSLAIKMIKSITDPEIRVQYINSMFDLFYMNQNKILTYLQKRTSIRHEIFTLVIEHREYAAQFQGKYDSYLNSINYDKKCVNLTSEKPNQSHFFAKIGASKFFSSASPTLSIISENSKRISDTDTLNSEPKRDSHDETAEKSSTHSLEDDFVEMTIDLKPDEEEINYHAPAPNPYSSYENL